MPDSEQPKAHDLVAALRFHKHPLTQQAADRIAELEAALKPFAAIGAQIRWLDGSGYTTARLRVDDIMTAQKTLKG